MGPWIVSAIVVAAILRRYRLRDIGAAMAEGHALRMLPIVAAFLVAQILLVSVWDTVILRSVLGGPRWWDLVRVKAACAVLTSVAYVANQGAYAVWIARATGAGARNAAGLVLYTMASDLLAGCLLVSGSIWIGGAEAPFLLRWGAPFGALVALSLLALLPRRPLDPREEASIIRVWQAVPRSRGVPQAFARLINFTMVVLATWGATRAFGLSIPLRAMFVYGPVVTVVGSLPVNVGGFGAVQAAWLLFLPWAKGPQLIAFQFLFSVMLLGCIVVRGLPFVRRIMAEVAEGRIAG